jgi:hypothetical protein
MIRNLWVSATVVLFAAAASSGQTFTENFEGGIPASWTILDNYPKPIPMSPAFSAVPWTTNLVEGMLNYTNGGGATGAGTAATASSANHPGQYDISLITPAGLIHAGADGDNVRYTINYQRTDAFEFFDTNLSINGGDWITMTHDTADLGPFFGTGPPKVTRTIDMGFFGAVPGDSVRVEFRYYSEILVPMVHNLYVQIDDVQMPVPEPAAVTFALVITAIWWRPRRRDS